MNSKFLSLSVYFSISNFLLMLLIQPMIILAVDQCPTRINEIIKELKGTNIPQIKRAIYKLHKLEKKAIPYLIEDIGEPPSLTIQLANPLSSQIKKEVLDNEFSGVPSAFIIELILGRDFLSENDFFDSDFLLGVNPENYIFWDGIIVKMNGKTISKNDWLQIEELYKTWWSKNKSKSISELRKEWKLNRRPLTNSVYRWE